MDTDRITHPAPGYQQTLSFPSSLSVYQGYEVHDEEVQQLWLVSHIVNQDGVQQNQQYTREVRHGPVKPV